MRLSHAGATAQIVFDDPNLLAHGGLLPMMGLAAKVDIAGLVDEGVRITGADNSAGANAGAKVMSLLAGMIAGGDSIEDTNRLRSTAMSRLFTGTRAPSTLGTFLRSFTHGHVKQVHAVHKQVLIALAAGADLLPGADQIAFADVDSMHRQVYGYTKQGAVNGRLKGQKTLHPLISTISTPLSRPVVAGIRMRKGNAADVRGAVSFVAETLATAKKIGCTGLIVLRGDAKFYTAEIVATAHRAGAYVSLTTGSNPSVNAAITTIPETAWTPIHYPDAFVDEDTGDLISDAEVTEIPYIAFTSKAKKLHATGRLIVRRVKRLNPTTIDGQDELFTTYRHHAVFVTSPFEMLQAETQHRGHAIHEQVNADAKSAALAHLPSASFPANAAWATLWAIAHNLTHTAGALASPFHARATTTTIRDHLITIPTRLATNARKLTAHMPTDWPWHNESAWVRWRLGYPAFSRVRGLMSRSLCRSWSAWSLPSAGVWSGPASSPA